MHSGDYVSRFENQPIRRIARLVEHMALVGDERIVDVGCGNALSLSALDGRFGTYAGVDFSAEFIEAAKERARVLGFHDAEFFCGLVQEFAQDNPERFDVALALDISEHVYDEEWIGILKSIYFMLKQGGRLFLHTPNAEFFVEILKERNIVLKQFPEHIAVRNSHWNAELLKEAGFQIHRSLTLPHYNVLQLIHPLYSLPRIGRYFGARLFIDATKPS